MFATNSRKRFLTNLSLNTASASASASANVPTIYTNTSKILIGYIAIEDVIEISIIADNSREVVYFEPIQNTENILKVSNFILELEYIPNTEWLELKNYLRTKRDYDIIFFNTNQNTRLFLNKFISYLR